LRGIKYPFQGTIATTDGESRWARCPRPATQWSARDLTSSCPSPRSRRR